MSRAIGIAGGAARGLALLASFGAASGYAAESYSPNAGDDHPIDVFWGDTHVHTSFSSGDAFALGNNTVTPETAYRFARGETVTAGNGMRARIRRPLDFLVIADHAEGMGVAAGLAAAGAKRDDADFGDRLGQAYRDFHAQPEQRRSIWRRVVDRAEAYNEPGRFTTFAGYEWSSGGSVNGVFGNLHRVVIFRDGPEATGDLVPFSAADSRNPEDLWAYLARFEAETGGRVIAIPHNPNLSNGEMFAKYTFDGSTPTTAWAEQRRRFEPLLEVTQLKGDSEAHPVLSPTDEFADFETWHSWAGYGMDSSGHPCCAARQEPSFTREAFREQKEGEYARSALKRGLVLGAKLGVNPYAFGLIGSTDTHTSLASADNDNFWGQYPNTPPSATRPTDRFTPSWKTPFHWETTASGYAAVWAHENTRTSLFAALERREVYASTGPRITVRFFGGWDFTAAQALAPNIARVGYRKGVPMGGEIVAADGRAPSFLVGASRDPDGAHLDRIQIVKGWLDATGVAHEQVYDVGLSDGRESRDGDRAEGLGSRVAPVGSTVDVAGARYTNAIGAPELTAVWRDPSFDPDQPAFYYARVIEIPTPRWPAYDAAFFGIEQLPDDVVVVTQERAYTSPIWYRP